MSREPGEREPNQGGPVFFPLNFPETSIVYSILYERSICLPSREELLDEIERRELYPTTRHVIPQAMDCIEDIQEAMRAYLVAFTSESAVSELEKRVEIAIEKMKGG